MPNDIVTFEVVRRRLSLGSPSIRLVMVKFFLTWERVVYIILENGNKSHQFPYIFVSMIADQNRLLLELKY